MDSMNNLRDAFQEFRRKHLRVVSNEPDQPKQEKTFTCGICKDTGFLRADVQPGHPQFGKAIPCVCTQQRVKEQQKEQLEGMSGIVRYQRYEKASFATFDRKAKGVRPAFAQAKTYAMEPDGWIVFVGPWGCGKTHLAVSIAKECLAAGASVLVQTVPDLLDHLRNAFSPSAETAFNELFEQMKTADLLVLDDYGAENTTKWAVEKLFQILNYRYNMALPTVITTNNIGLEGIDPRVKSRLHDSGMVTIVEMLDAEDYRPNLKKEKGQVVDAQ